MRQPCVIARLFGGLGNQLFIYAFAKALAERNGVPLKFDTQGGFARDPVYRRRFLLDRLMTDISPASRWESRSIPLGRHLRSLDRRLNRLLPLQSRRFIQERTMAFDPEIYNLKILRPTVFNGVWQSPRYFDNLDMDSLLCFPRQLIEALAEESDSIRKSNAVCLAIRRYEEVPKPKHHILQADYYRKAMAQIEQRVDKPHYFVFAQDMEWARTNIESDHPLTFATARNPYEGVIQDLYLMTLCRHFILSNSSLHWWAAWFGQHERSRVIAPAIGWPSSDILPSTWMQMD
jgi:hypothetical protein